MQELHHSSQRTSEPAQMKCVTYKGVPFLIPAPGEKKNSRDVGMAYWWKDSLKSALTYTEQVWYVHKFVELNDLRVLELFAGLGVSTAPLKHKINAHVGVDHDSSSLDAFKALHEDAVAVCANSYEIYGELFQDGLNYVLAEYNAITTYRALQDPKEKPMFEKLFTSDVEYVAYVDSAKVKEHLHYERYSKFFDSPIYDSATYIEGVANYIKRKFNYGLKAVAFDSVNYTMLFKKGARVSLENIQDTRQLVNLKQYKEVCNADL